MQIRKSVGRLSVVGVVIAAAVIFALWRFYPRPTTATGDGLHQPSVETEIVSQLASEAAGARAIPIGRPDTVPKRSASAVIRKEFENATNYAAFIQTALLRPKEGGRFYALIAYHRCSEVANVELPPPVPDGLVADTLFEKGYRRINEIRQACSGVQSQYQDQFTFMRSIRDAKGEPDALLVERGFLGPATREGSLADLELARDSGDNYFLAATLEANVDYLGEYLDKAYANGQNRTVLYAAASAAACEIAGTCKFGLGVMIPCVSGGICQFDDHRDLIRMNLSPELRAQFDRTRMGLVKLSGHQEQ